MFYLTVICFLSLVERRLTLADIERIAPLAEGALPYNLAELQRQVGRRRIKLLKCLHVLAYEK